MKTNPISGPDVHLIRVKCRQGICTESIFEPSAIYGRKEALRANGLVLPKPLAFDANSKRLFSEALAVSQANGNPVTEGIQKIILSLAVLVSNPEVLDLLDKMISKFLLVDDSFGKCVLGIFDMPAIDIAGDRDCPFVLTERS